MQEIHSFGGGSNGGRLFGGGGGGGDRRLRPNNNNHQTLKCPRCDSLNTKFCYYNNYNLSQPRHFCKSCRRYWTKGGVLRNVPVGGGCRKNKRSLKHNKTTSPNSETIATTATVVAELKSTTNSHSSSESSSLTATNNVNTNCCNFESSTTSFKPNEVNNTNCCNFESSTTSFLEQGGPDNSCAIFSEINGSFTSLINTSSANEQLQFGFDANLLSQQSQWTQNQIDQTVEIGSRGNEGFGLLDWQGSSGDNDTNQSLFDDLPNAVDHAYWSQSQWTDQDPSGLYIP